MRWCFVALTPTLALAAPVYVPATFQVLDSTQGAAAGPLSTTPSLWTDATSTDPNDQVWSGNATTVPLDNGVGTVVLGGDGQPALDSSVLHAPTLWLDVGNGIPRQPVVAGGVARITEEVAWAERFVVQDGGARRWSDGTFAPDCMGYLEPEAGSAYLGATGSGVYTVDPDADGSGFSVYCDMETDGGGWALVWKNVGGDLIGTVSNQALLASPNASIVLPPELATGSEMHGNGLAAWGSSPGKEWLKRTVLWNPAGEIVSNSRLRLDMGQATLTGLFSSTQTVDKECFQQPDRMLVYVDGVYVGGTSYVWRNFLSAPSFGLPSDYGSNTFCGLDASEVLVTERAPLAEGQTDRWRAPDVLSYRHDVASESSSRCYHACWDASWAGYSEAFVWGVR